MSPGVPEGDALRCRRCARRGRSRRSVGGESRGGGPLRGLFSGAVANLDRGDFFRGVRGVRGDCGVLPGAHGRPLRLLLRSGFRLLRLAGLRLGAATLPRLSSALLPGAAVGRADVRGTVAVAGGRSLPFLLGLSSLFFGRRFQFARPFVDAAIRGPQRFDGQALAEMHHHGGVERLLLGAVAFEAQKILQIRVFFDLFDRLLVGEIHAGLDDESAHSDPERECGVFPVEPKLSL